MQGKRVVLTGAGGGIGSRLAGLLAGAGARVTAVDLSAAALEPVCSAHPDHIVAVTADIADLTGRRKIVDTALQAHGGIDILVNAAAISPFGVFAEQDEALLQKTLEINTLAPVLLTRAVLPVLLKQQSGQIVNIGSTFGSIGFAWFAAYSTSKFALRGFSQALRRELADSGIDVSYIAPRAVKTALNSAPLYDMAAAVKMNMDDPDRVAQRILEAIRQRRKECYIGFPESMFVRINALLPGLVDRALRVQNRVARQFASRPG